MKMGRSYESFTARQQVCLRAATLTKQLGKMGKEGRIKESDEGGEKHSVFRKTLKGVVLKYSKEGKDEEQVAHA